MKFARNLSQFGKKLRVIFNKFITDYFHAKARKKSAKIKKKLKLVKLTIFKKFDT